AKPLHFHLSISNFFLFSNSHPPFQSLFPVLRFCFDCAAFPYSLFFSFWRTCSPGLTAYHGIAGGHKDDSCPFGLLTGWFPCPDHAIFGLDTPRSASKRGTLFFQLSRYVRYVWNLILCYLLYILLSTPFL